MTNRRRLLTAAVAVVGALLGLLPAPADALGAGPAMASVDACRLTPTNGTETRTMPGYPQQPYRVRVPSGLTGPARLLVSLHGWSTLSVTPAQDNENNSGLNEFASQTRSIVVYPTGSFVGLPGAGGITFAQGWDYWDADSPDITYLENVVAHVAAEFCVDPDRVHADGISMGGLMSERLLCEAGDVFASTSGHATNDVEDPWVTDLTQPGSDPDDCDPPPSAAFLLSCGSSDALTACDTDALAAWKARLGCTTYVRLTTLYGSLDDYTCSGGRDLRQRTWTGLGHAYPQQFSPWWPLVVDTARRDRWIGELSAFYDANTMP